MWELDHKKAEHQRMLWCFQIVVLEKILESHLDRKEIKPINPEGNQPWIFIGETVLKLKLRYFGHLMWSWLIGNDPDDGKHGRQKENVATEDEIVG